MSEAPEPKSFWSTLPGLLTAVGGVITAIAALLAALHAVGIIGPSTPTPSPVAPPTPSPVPAPTEPSDASVLLEDSFDVPSSGWEVSASKDYEVGYQDGEYRMVNYGLQTIVWSTPGSESEFTDFILEIDARQVDGPLDNYFGVLVRYQADQDSGYRFQISGDGYFAVDRSDSGQESSLVGGTESEAVNQGLGPVNRLRVACEQSECSFFVNGTHLVDLSDDTFRSGTVGLTVTTFDETGVVVHFDNLQVRSLDQQTSP